MQHPDDQTYPTTGVNDLDFPEPSSFAPTEFLRCFVRQMIFPFDTGAVRRATHGSPHAPDVAEESHHGSDTRWDGDRG